MSLKVKGIDVSRLKSKEFVLTAFYILGLNRKGSEVYACIKCKLHLVEDFKANMLIGNNILYIEGFTINLASVSAHILRCGVIIVINATSYL